MTFPTIPTLANTRLTSTNNASTSTARLFTNFSSFTHNAGDLLIAVAICYQTSVGTNAAFSNWTNGFTEFHDSATATTMAIGCAYKFDTGAESGQLSVDQAATITGQCICIFMSIAGAHASTPPEAGGRNSSTDATQANATSVTASWGAADNLWIAVAGDGEDSLTGSYTGISAAPLNYGSLNINAITSDTVGGTNAATAFRQLNAASEDVGAWTADTSLARHAAITIVVRPAAVGSQPTISSTRRILPQLVR